MLKLTNIELTEGQKTHVLRHTFGAHFMMNGGNILVLQKILGHSNIRETMSLRAIRQRGSNNDCQSMPCHRRKMG